MSTTRSQKRRNILQKNPENVHECLISPVVVGRSEFLDQDVSTTVPSNAKSPRIENSVLERAFLREEITSEIKALLIESEKELLKPKTLKRRRRNRPRK